MRRERGRREGGGEKLRIRFDKRNNFKTEGVKRRLELECIVGGSMGRAEMRRKIKEGRKQIHTHSTISNYCPSFKSLNSLSFISP